MNPKHTARPVARRFSRRLSFMAAVCLGIACTANAQPHVAYPPISTAASLPFEQLERLAMQHVSYIKKLEVRDLLLKVDGFDTQGMKVKVYLDRRTGDLLSREVKFDKHGPFGKHSHADARGWSHPRHGHPDAHAPTAPRPQPGVAPRTYFPNDRP